MKLKLLTEFRKDEHGGILAFYVVMFMLMMVGGGMSIDFMRQEIKREAMQDALDRGVLAAAGNAQTSISGVLTDAQTTAAENAATATVRSYITIAGFDPDAESVVISPTISATTQRVVASSSFSVDTYFLRLSGIDVLNSAARSGAAVGAQKIEISLVLDISGSMDTPVPGSNPDGTNFTRLEMLQDAAKQFSVDMLAGDRSTYTSISIVPFSGQVSVSDILAAEYDNFGNSDRWHTYSNCLEFNASDYSTTAFGPNEARNQYQHFYITGQRGGANSGLDPELVSWCPASNMNVLPLANDITKINALIDGLTPQAATNTWTGIKWGAALLDHSTQPIVSALTTKNCTTVTVDGVSTQKCEIDPEFSNRPVAFKPVGGSSDTLKFLIVMADGENYEETIIPYDVYNQDEANSYSTQGNADYYELNQVTGWYGTWVQDSDGNWSRNANSIRTTANTGDTLMQNMCTAAKTNGIIVYTIGTDIALGSNASNQMRDCASTVGQFYSVSSDDLAGAFDGIVNAIQKLRLVN